MERFTERDEFGGVYPKTCILYGRCDCFLKTRNEKVCARCSNLCQRLADYEDTGLTPEEIRVVTALLAKAAGLLPRCCDNCAHWIPPDLPKLIRARCRMDGCEHLLSGRAENWVWKELPEWFKELTNEQD